MNLKKLKTIHFTGIKGVGMTALALCAQDLGKIVTGSDTDETFPTDPVLKKRGIKVKLGFKSQNLPRHCDLLIYTGAHGGSTNPEVIAAKAQAIPVLSHAEALGLFSQGKKTLAVAGVGGKTTVAAMLANLLDSAGFQPSFAVGVGNIFSLNTPGRMIKTSACFVVEADEYVTDPKINLTPRFHYLKADLAIITNLEYDHPDVYPSLDAVYRSFVNFLKPVPASGAIIINIDNPKTKTLINLLNRPVITYGFSPLADWQIIKTHLAEKKQFFTLKFNGITWPEMILSVPGRYNVLNATAAIAAANFLGVSVNKIKRGIKSFTGTKRRFEFIATIKGVSLYDDYAHHPSEIKAVLQAARDWLPGKRLIPVFQSHTYSRTKALLQDFAASFTDADLVVINDIFSSARETDNLGLTGRIFAAEVKKHHAQVFYCSGKTATLEFIRSHCKKGDVLLTLGAGNNFLWHKDILKTLKKL